MGRVIGRCILSVGLLRSVGRGAYRMVVMVVVVGFFDG